MDKCREQFEEWAAIEGLPLLFLDKHNFYESHVTDIAWQAWQASRQALVVEIPDMPYYEFSIYKLQDALNDAGVRYVWVESESD